jgi:hypothetical protein
MITRLFPVLLIAAEILPEKITARRGGGGAIAQRRESSERPTVICHGETRPGARRTARPARACAVIADA